MHCHVRGSHKAPSLDNRPSKSEPLDQTSASSRPESARPSKIIDQSPVSRPKSRATVTARGVVPVASPDCPKATGTVFCIPILVPRFPAPDHAETDNRLFLVRIVFAVEIREAPPVAEGRRMKSVIALPASDVMHRHPASDRCRESYPRRSELHQNYYSRDGDEQSAVPAGV